MESFEELEEGLLDEIRGVGASWEVIDDDSLDLTMEAGNDASGCRIVTGISPSEEVALEGGVHGLVARKVKVWETLHRLCYWGY